MGVTSLATVTKEMSEEGSDRGRWQIFNHCTIACYHWRPLVGVTSLAMVTKAMIAVGVSGGGVVAVG